MLPPGNNCKLGVAKCKEEYGLSRAPRLYLPKLTLNLPAIVFILGQIKISPKVPPS